MHERTAQHPTSNVFDTALIWEGGGMRAAYSSGVVTTLLAHQINFDWVAGISAGAACACNYVSRDAARARRSFVDIAAHPNFGDFRTWVQGKGYFHAEWLYEHTGGPGQLMPFDFATFQNNPAQVRIGAVNAYTGETVYWSKDDLQPLPALMRKVRASSTMPILMPMPEIDGDPYVDGGLGTTGGIALDVAKADGFDKFFIVLTRQRGFRERPFRRPGLYRGYLRAHPAVGDALVNRWRRYNDTLEEVEELERQGKAYVFRPVDVRIGNGERRLARLAAAYEVGRVQSAGEVGRWREFLGL